MCTRKNEFMDPESLYASVIPDEMFETRDKALKKIKNLLDGKISSHSSLILQGIIDRLETLPVELKKSILLNTYYYYWWSKVVQLYGNEKWSELNTWLLHGMNFGIVECLFHNSTNKYEAFVTNNNEIRIPGHSFYFILPVSVKKAFLSVVDDQVLISIHGQDIKIPLENITYRQEHLCLKHLQVVSNTTIDSTNPLIQDQIKQLQLSLGEATKFEGVDELSEQSALNLSKSLEFLNKIWPEFTEEFNSYVKLIIPFSAKNLDAFTNSNWPNAIFLSNEFDNIAFTVERLVHETSHLRLNLINLKDRLHLNDQSETIPSPFRSGPRPVLGLIHGIYVFTRVAHSMYKAYLLTDEHIYLGRVVHIIEQVKSGISIAREQVSLTDLSTRMIHEMENEISILEKKIGNKVVEPISSLELLKKSIEV